MGRRAAEAEEVSADNALTNEGMRLAAAYLNGDGTNLLEQLKSKAPEEQMAVRGGMARTLLRNIVLPRDDQISEQSLHSLVGLQELSGNSSDIASLCSAGHCYSHSDGTRRQGCHRLQVG